MLVLQYATVSYLIFHQKPESHQALALKPGATESRTGLAAFGIIWLHSNVTVLALCTSDVKLREGKEKGKKNSNLLQDI